MNHTDSVGSSVSAFSNDSINSINPINSVNSVNSVNSINSDHDAINNVSKSENYSFHVNVTVNDYEKQNTYILSNYDYSNEFKGFKNKELLLNFTVFDENGITVKNGTKVSVYIFSKEYNSMINSNGKVTIPITIDTIGTFAFEVRYIGNDYYENSRNFTYISIIDKEFESDVNNSENVSLTNNFDYNVISKFNLTENNLVKNNLSKSNLSKSNLDIITFKNFIYNGISKKLTFIVPKIEGSKGSHIEVSIYAFFDDGSLPNMDLTVIFNGIKIPVHCINGLIKFNITLPNYVGIYSLDVLFNSSVSNVNNNSVINKSNVNKDLNNLDSSNNYYNGINMDKTSNPVFLLIIIIFSLFISYKKS